MDQDYGSVEFVDTFRKNFSTQTDFTLVDISNLEQISKQLENMYGLLKEWMSERLTSLDEPTSQLLRELVKPRNSDILMRENITSETVYTSTVDHSKHMSELTNKSLRGTKINITEIDFQDLRHVQSEETNINESRTEQLDDENEPLHMECFTVGEDDTEDIDLEDNIDQETETELQEIVQHDQSLDMECTNIKTETFNNFTIGNEENEMRGTSKNNALDTLDFEKRKENVFCTSILNHQNHLCWCNMCGDSFSAISALTYHVRMQHGKIIKPYQWQKRTSGIANDLGKYLGKNTDGNVERHMNKACKDSGQNETLKSKIQHIRGPVRPIMQSFMMTVQPVQEFPENPNTCSLLNKKVDKKCEINTENKNTDVNLKVLRNESKLPEHLKLHSYYKPVFHVKQETPMEEDERVQKMPGPLTITPEAYQLNQQLQETLASSPGKSMLSNGIVQGVKSMQVDHQSKSSDQKQGKLLYRLFLVNKRKRENNLENNRQFNISETTVDGNTDKRIDSKVETISVHAIVKRNESITGGNFPQEKKQVEDNKEISKDEVVPKHQFDNNSSCKMNQRRISLILHDKCDKVDMNYTVLSKICCAVCFKEFPSFSEVKSHLRINHRPPSNESQQQNHKYKCKTCGAIFIDPLVLISHSFIHSDSDVMHQHQSLHMKTDDRYSNKDKGTVNVEFQSNSSIINKPIKEEKLSNIDMNINSQDRLEYDVKIQNKKKYFYTNVE
ncbi:ZBTB44 [Mytilus coruscus]|uniref:ZBTB44 n=1 Tax=Mytilus coruscus TaxID=42192 RepID=A0A6J8DUI8_MYTCO|nr:ZBTB44 [Mytilus coruscus]